MKLLVITYFVLVLTCTSLWEEEESDTRDRPRYGIPGMRWQVRNYGQKVLKYQCGCRLI